MKCSVLAAFLFTCSLAAQSDPGTGIIEGRVLNSLNAEPIRKATVVLTSPIIRFELVANTDAAGKFQFTGLPPATYRLAAKHAGFFNRPARRAISLNPNDNVADIEIRLPPRSAISGRVLDEDGDPIAGARIGILKQVYKDGRKLWERYNDATVTNQLGEFHFSGLKAGRYLVEAQDERPPVDNQFGAKEHQSGVYVRTYYRNAQRQEEGSPVEVGVGTEVSGIDIHLVKILRPPTAPSVHVRGRIIGVPPASQVVIFVRMLTSEGETPSGDVQANSPEYQFDMVVPAGRYSAFAYVYAGPRAFSAITSITAAEDVNDVVLTMNPPAYITGRLSLAENDPKVKLEGIPVNLRWSEFFGAGAYSDAKGKFAFAEPVRPGHMSVNIEKHRIPENCYIQRVMLGSEEISLNDFEVSGSDHIEIVLSNKAATITGTVLDGDDKPFPISVVTLIPANTRFPPAKQSVDDTGAFKFTGVAPGKYQLFAWEEVDDDLWQDPEFRKNYENRASEVTVGAAETQTAKVRVIPVEAIK